MGVKRAIWGLMLLIGGFVLVIAVILGISLGSGWLLTLILPLSLFEGTVLILMVVSFTLYLVRSGSNPFYSDLDIDDEPTYKTFDSDWLIKADRFQRGEEGNSWGNCMHYVLSNQVYIEMEKEPEVVLNMSTVQRQELAVRLAGIAVGALMYLRPKGGQYRMTISALKRELNRHGLKPYDKELLQLTMYVVNSKLQRGELLFDVVDEEMWGDECTLPGW